MKFYAKKQNGGFVKNFGGGSTEYFFSLEEIKKAIGEDSYSFIPKRSTLYGYKLLNLYEAQPVFDHMPKYFIYSVHNLVEKNAKD